MWIFNSTFTIFACMPKLHSFTKFAFMRNPHVYMDKLQKIYLITCVVENRRPEWSVTWTQCSLAFLICAMLECPSLPQGSSLKKKSVSGGSFIRGKSVKKYLSHASYRWPNIKPSHGWYRNVLENSSSGFSHSEYYCASQIVRLVYGLIQTVQMQVIFTHLKLWVAVARHNFKWVKI